MIHASLHMLAYVTMVILELLITCQANRRTYRLAQLILKLRKIQLLNKSWKIKPKLMVAMIKEIKTWG